MSDFFRCTVLETMYPGREEWSLHECPTAFLIRRSDVLLCAQSMKENCPVLLTVKGGLDGDDIFQHVVSGYLCDLMDALNGKRDCVDPLPEHVP